MTLHVWLAFVAASVLIAFSPGSGAVLAMSHGLNYGLRRASVTILGLQLGLLLIFMVAGLGVGSLLLASEAAFLAIKLLGGTYLIYLGWRQWRADSVGGWSVRPADAVECSWKKQFLLGFLTNASNPKGIVFMVAVLPQFIQREAPLAMQLAVMAATLLAIDTLVMHGYAASASVLRRFAGSAAFRRGQNRLFGALLMAIGAGLFFVRRQS